MEKLVNWSMVVMWDELLARRIGSPHSTRFPLTFGNCDYFSPRFLFGTLLSNNPRVDIAYCATLYPWDRQAVRSDPRRTRPGCKLFCGTVLGRKPCRVDTSHLSVQRVVSSLWLLWWALL